MHWTSKKDTTEIKIICSMQLILKLNKIDNNKSIYSINNKLKLNQIIEN